MRRERRIHTGEDQYADDLPTGRDPQPATQQLSAADHSIGGHDSPRQQHRSAGPVSDPDATKHERFRNPVTDSAGPRGPSNQLLDADASLLLDVAGGLLAGQGEPRRVPGSRVGRIQADDRRTPGRAIAAAGAALAVLSDHAGDIWTSLVVREQ